ncbi:AraC family transcriptional regulator [Escherichia coli]|uniref:AraC family transcriptional regulator n=1 Tax=Escherichia coli TaxID=562 RepID=UPI000BE5F373|nr:AraC family transcriptional regulator [Escherichia coli]MBB8643116.1 helix-turn-helix transcriptional regulator [Escherichia coli]
MEKNLCNKLTVKVKLYQSAIIYSSNSIITIRDIKKNDSVIINQGEMFFLERNLNMKISVRKTTNASPPYEVISIDNNKLGIIVKMLEPFCRMSAINKQRLISDRVLRLLDDAQCKNKNIFHYLKNNNDEKRNILEFAYLLSRAVCLEKLYTSLCVSASRTFTDKIRETIERDLSRKWRLSAIADELNISEITIRKKLEIENINFNQVLLDVRMQASAKLILNGNHINKISSALGMSSTSYFIRIFSNYYGVTPKQFYLYHKTDKTSHK